MYIHFSLVSFIMEQQTCFKKEKEYSMLYIVTMLIYLIYGVHHEKRWAG